jgi:O-antigen/teichoic acid export membrane protein
MINPIRTLLHRLLPKSTFARQVSVLTSGTAIAQAIPIAISPILTRLYAPDDFGLASLYLSCVAVISVIATGRYELAITLPSRDEDALHIVSLTLKLCTAVCVFLYLPIVLFGKPIATVLGNSELATWFYLLPVTVLATVSFHVFQYWYNRTSQYREISTQRVQNAFFMALLKVAVGLGQLRGGIILGYSLASILSASLIGHSVWQQNRQFFSIIQSKGEIKQAKRYANHPMHITPAQLLGVVAQQIPLFMISNLYSPTTLGFFSMAYRMVSLPTGLIANAIGDVYRQKISVAYNERGEFRDIFLKTLRITMLFAAPPFIFLYFASPFLFEVVFGSTWRIAGEYAQVLVVMSFFQFICTPLDKGALVVGATAYILSWHTLRLFSFAIMFFSTAYFSIRVEEALWVFTAINTFIYILDVLVEYRYAIGKYL